MMMELREGSWEFSQADCVDYILLKASAKMAVMSEAYVCLAFLADIPWKDLITF